MAVIGLGRLVKPLNMGDFQGRTVNLPGANSTLPKKKWGFGDVSSPTKTLLGDGQITKQRHVLQILSVL